MAGGLSATKKIRNIQKIKAIEQDFKFHLGEVPPIIDGTLVGVEVREIIENAKKILEFLMLREKYCSLVSHSFNKTAARFLSYYRELLATHKDSRPADINVKPGSAKVSPASGTHPYQRPLLVPENFNKEIEFRMKEGVVHIYERDAPNKEWKEMNLGVQVPTLKEFLEDLGKINDGSSSGPLNSFAAKRCDSLKQSFHLYALNNELLEANELKALSHRDFYNVCKVRSVLNLVSLSFLHMHRLSI